MFCCFYSWGPLARMAHQLQIRQRLHGKEAQKPIANQRGSRKWVPAANCSPGGYVLVKYIKNLNPLLGKHLEASGKHLEASGRHLEASGRHLEASGGIWRHLGGIWEPSGSHLEEFGSHLGGIWEASGRPGLSSRLQGDMGGLRLNKLIPL